MAILRPLLDLLFPPLCHLCRVHIPAAGELHLCDPCRQAIRFIGTPLCSVCGVPFATEGGMDHRCGECTDSPPPFSAARSVAHFDGPVQELVHRLKYGHRVHLRRPLALLFVERLGSFLADASPQVVVPVPLHRRRLAERGFNQAALIGRPVAAALGIPLDPLALARSRATAAQVSLHADERMRNVRGAFELRRPESVRGKRVLLLDDVYTTGSTVRECARVLRKGGASEVYVATAARAL
ncbi:MAG TPA: ComF family protein [Verrucomicrobiae bacterium]|nr:ComF family protein [Verrucomicrobiae bacterium]